MPYQGIAYRAFWNLGPGFVAMPGLLGFKVSSSAAVGPNGLGWGTDVEISCDIRATDDTAAANWRLIPWYGEIQKNGGAWVRVFSGVLTDRSDDGEGLRYVAQGFKEKIKRAPVRTPLRYRRPIATRTTATSTENPASGAYLAGMANEVFWRAGGRPFEQASLYTTAPWYYSCDASPVAPEWPWVDGENAWDALLELARAGGGQIYQDGNGVVRYVNPLKLAETGGSPPHFTNSVYGRLTVDESVEGVFNVARSNYVRRALAIQQEIAKDTTPRTITPSAFIDVAVPFQWPIYDITAVVVVAARATGEPVTPTVTTLEETAQQLTIRITNPLSTERIQVTQIRVEGNPITVAGEGVAVVTGPTFTGDGSDVELRLEDSVYIQTQDDAERRCRMALAFYGRPRPIHTARDCPYDPTWFVGQYALVSNTRRGLASVGARIVSISIYASGERCDVGLVLLDGVPKLSDFFVAGQAYPGTTQRRLGY